MNNTERNIRERGLYKKDDLRLILLVVTVFWSLFLVFYTLVRILHSLGTFRGIHMEYWPFEQLSKFYLLLTILISAHSYIVQHLRRKIKLSICFLLIGLLMYLSESNMISQNAQPLFDFIILSYTFYLLFKCHEWEVSLLLFLGCVSLSIGSAIDILHDFTLFQRLEYVITLLFKQIPDNLKFSYLTEETFEVVGAGFVCLSVIIYSIESLSSYFRNNKLTTTSFLVTIAMITLGNSFLHWQYNLSREFMAFSLAITLFGVLGLIKLSQNTNKKNGQTIIGLPNLEIFSTFIFSFFYILPTVFGRISNTISVIMWLPTVIILGFFLIVQHPSVREK